MLQGLVGVYTDLYTWRVEISANCMGWWVFTQICTRGELRFLQTVWVGGCSHRSVHVES